MRSLILVAALLLSGCASVISSKVTTFHEWEGSTQGKTYQFDTPPGEAANSLEWRNYQNLVRNQLGHLGLVEATAGAKPELRVAMGLKGSEFAYRVVYDPYPLGRPLPWYGLRSPWHSPFYRPGWYDLPEQQKRVTRRELHVSITRAADGKRLWEATVRNEEESGEDFEIMPILVYSAFVGFPGPNGGTRQIHINEK